MDKIRLGITRRGVIKNSRLKQIAAYILCFALTTFSSSTEAFVFPLANVLKKIVGNNPVINKSGFVK